MVAASIHVGLLSRHYLPSKEQLLELPFFDKQAAKDHGIIRFIGQDEYGNEIYLMGRKNSSDVAATVLRGIGEAFGISRSSVYFVDVIPYVNWMMMLGGYLSRRWGFISVGRPIVIKGVLHSYWEMVSLVDQIKMTVAKRPLKE